MFITDYKYSRSSRENLLLPIRMQLSRKVKMFGQIFILVLESKLNFDNFQKKLMVIA